MKRLSALGAAVMCVALILLPVLPRIIPIPVFNCGQYEGGTQCFGCLNPLYPIVFTVAISGVVLLFYGLFGRNFILRPLFMIGMLLDAFGLLNIIFWIHRIRVVRNSQYSLCMDYHPEFAEPFILAGSILIAVNSALVNTFKRYTNPEQRVEMYIGVVSIAVGAILMVFGWIVVGTFVGNYETIHWTFCLQIALGFALLVLGVALVRSSRKSEGTTLIARGDQVEEQHKKWNVRSQQQQSS